MCYCLSCDSTCLPRPWHDHTQRPGAFAIYLEPWHADVFDFLDLKKNHGSEEKAKTLPLVSLSSSLPSPSLSRTYLPSL